MSRTWFITGASSGFGRAMAERLLARGDRVAATLRRMEALDDLKATHGERLWIAALDVTDTAVVREVVGRAFAELGRIHVVVNNAGYGLAGSVEEVTDAQIDHQLATNLVGSIQVIRAAMPHLRAQGGGRILQVSSLGGQATFPNLSLYHASKWGVEGFVEAVALEVAPFGVEFTIVQPGAARTGFGVRLAVAEPMAAYADTPAGVVRRMSAEGAFPTPGDPGKMVQAMIDSVDINPAPKRLTLGGDAYAMVRAALVERLEILDAQKALALSTDA